MPLFSGSNKECYSFEKILWRCLSFTLRSAPLPAGKDPDYKLRAVISRLLKETHKTMKIRIYTRYKKRAAKPVFYRVSYETILCLQVHLSAYRTVRCFLGDKFMCPLWQTPTHLPQGTRFVPMEGRILTYSVQNLYSFPS